MLLWKRTQSRTIMMRLSGIPALTPALWRISRKPTLLLPRRVCRSFVVAKVTHKLEMRPLEQPDIVTEEPASDSQKSSASKADKDMFVPPSAIMMDKNSLRRLHGTNIYLGPNTTDFRIKQAEFVKASTRVRDCPHDGLPEFALVGRSNVGKSSLVNALVQKKEFAETSKKPGKTRVISHYLINKSWYLVDLPGYGYAKVPTDVRTGWNAFTKDFFLRSQTLVCVILLIDASIPSQQMDLECADWLGRNKIPLTIVFTKCDKKNKKDGTKVEENLMGFLQLLKKSYDQMPPWIMTSCVTNQGRDELLMHMAQLRNYWGS